MNSEIMEGFHPTQKSSWKFEFFVQTRILEDTIIKSIDTLSKTFFSTLFYTSKVRNSSPALIPNAGITF